MHLCKICQAMRPTLYHITDDSEIPYTAYSNHAEGYDDVIDAAEADCYVCDILFTKLCRTVFVRHGEIHPITYYVAVTKAKDGEDVMGDPELRFYHTSDKPGKSRMIFLESFHLVSLTPYMLEQMTVDVPPHSNLPRALGLARKWLTLCNASHATCMDNFDPAWYPTRLLEIDTQTSKPVLIESKSSFLRGGYACLSHCWGSLPITRLLLANYSSFRKGIDLTSLPKTFRDAVNFCQHLGLRYLWIDSLCIIQDSIDDWREESNMMGKVYRNSALCLSAASAKDASMGFYFDRNKHDIGPLPPCPPFSDDQYEQSSQYLCHHSWHLVPRTFYMDLCERTPTFLRAWIFQERFLASRVLHFGKKQVFWECCTANYCETFPDGLPQRVMGTTDILPKATYEKIRTNSYTQAIDHPRIFNISSRTAAAQMQMTWEALVTEYTRGKLSNPGDKLVALSGMAQSFWSDWKSKLGEGVQYVAGTWNTHLPLSLLWRTTCTAPRPSVYRAPTWSWPSIEGRIDFQLEHWNHAYECTSTILDISISHVKSSWGRVKEGHLWVKGPVRKMKWANYDSLSDYATYDEEHKLPTKNEPSEHGVEINPGEYPEDRTELWGELHALLVMRFVDPSVKSRCIIVLNPVADQLDTFHRVGIFPLMSGIEVANWFDGVAQRVMKII